MPSKEALERARKWVHKFSLTYKPSTTESLADLLDEAIREARKTTMHDAVQIAAGYANEITSPFCEEKVTVADCMIAAAKEIDTALRARLAQLREGKT